MLVNSELERVTSIVNQRRVRKYKVVGVVGDLLGADWFGK